MNHHLAALLVFACLIHAPVCTGAAEPAGRSLLVLDFELIDEQAGLVAFPEKEARLAMVSQRLRLRLAAERLYRVLDPAPVVAEMREISTRSSFLTCNGCELDVARKLGAERVLLAWVQKVSNLIININIEIRDVANGRTLLTKSVDLRGNTERSWRRGVDYLIRSMIERDQRNL